MLVYDQKKKFTFGPLIWKKIVNVLLIVIVKPSKIFEVLYA